MDFRKAFASVHRGTLWELLRFRGIPEKIFALVRALYTDSESAVRYGGGTSEFFLVPTVVRQGCVFAPSLFSVSTYSGEVHSVTYFDFADDEIIFAQTMKVPVVSLGVLSKESENLELGLLGEDKNPKLHPDY